VRLGNMIKIVSSVLAGLIKLFILILGAFLTFACQQNSAPPDSNKTVWVNPNQLKPGNIKHEQLTDAQIARIRKVQSVFAEVDPSSLDEWIDNFKRDAHPDRELFVWEKMANAYSRYVTGKDLSLEAKKDVFQVVLLRSGAAEDEVITHMNLQILTEKDAREIMKFYEVVKID
jgi:hypothetical protein